MENMMKPYETCENIDAMNDLAIEANMDVFKKKDQGMYEELREFVIVKMKGFIDR
ncbi:hypothetical protein RhiirA4_484043 [Rhizophagus irregularis]|uniref:Uncharacterized protein n=1 Tax=Rhizophagus irregularis TaxID=588596 RepID=A0A2I1HNC7_9GLOM|nr:hypothetical protein RhiirA4_484043 [Rhizophagus irregularis]